MLAVWTMRPPGPPIKESGQWLRKTKRDRQMVKMSESISQVDNHYAYDENENDSDSVTYII